MQTSRETRPPRRWDKPRYVPKRKVCAFCRDKIQDIDYKNSQQLRRFVSDRGKIEPRRKTGTCAKHQRILAMAIKRARHVALLPFVPDHIRETGGVGLRD
ncbi:MAG: 30S ribosomal protein S18 [Chloroflexi bacterium]|nr:30S ribosomal protein S18 [Chloroflexota bacterium]